MVRVNVVVGAQLHGWRVAYMRSVNASCGVCMVCMPALVDLVDYGAELSRVNPGHDLIIC